MLKRARNPEDHFAQLANSIEYRAYMKHLDLELQTSRQLSEATNAKMLAPTAKDMAVAIEQEAQARKAYEAARQLVIDKRLVLESSRVFLNAHAELGFQQAFPYL